MPQHSSQQAPQHKHSWLEAWLIYIKPKVLVMLFLGFSAGLPLYLIFSSLSIWLREAGVSRTEVTYFSFAALAFSFKFIWAPLIDKLPLPYLYGRLGRRRSWLLFAQLSIAASIMAMAMIDPTSGLSAMAIAVIALGFSAATQDIVIDAYRIEAADKDSQAAMSAIYIAGYRIGMLVSGAGALILAERFAGDIANATGYQYQAWQFTYLIMAGLTLVGIFTTLIIKEPEPSQAAKNYIHTTSDYLRLVFLFIAFTCGFSSVFIVTADIFGSGFFATVLRMSSALAAALLLAIILVALNIVSREIFMTTYVDPVKDFFQRFGKFAVLILLLIGIYRISDIVLGVIANVFYLDMGFTKQQIGVTSKGFGLIMTLVGGFVGGVLTLRFGVMRILLLGAILSAATNILFILLAQSGNDIMLLRLVIAADNLSAGLAMAAFIAYLSSLTNISFTAVQYAIFSSLMTLIPKTLGGYSGSIVDSLGYTRFFISTAILGLPVIILIVYLMLKQNTLLAANSKSVQQEN